MKQIPSHSPFYRLGQRLGMIYQDDGKPTVRVSKRSRYGLGVSPRLDQDVDELRAHRDARAPCEMFVASMWDDAMRCMAFNTD